MLQKSEFSFFILKGWSIVKVLNLFDRSNNVFKAQRKCSKCGNETMTYVTKQTRSADEGQTVFYTCTRCR